jgi:hypothetical protein
VAAESAVATWQPPKTLKYTLVFFMAPIMAGAGFDWV